MVLLNNLVLLAEILKHYLKLNQVEVLCHLMECLITAIVLQKKGIDIEDESGDEDCLDDLPEEMSSVLKKLSGCVTGFIEVKLFRPLEGITDTGWHKELQVIVLHMTTKLYLSIYIFKRYLLRSCILVV